MLLPLLDFNAKLGIYNTRSRHGKTGREGRVNQVASQTGRGLSRVELTRIFQNFFF